MIVTAKESKLKPYDYLKYVFEKLPNMDLENDEEIAKNHAVVKRNPKRYKNSKKSIEICSFCGAIKQKVVT